MLRTEADMWQSEQKFMRIGRFGRGTGSSDRQHYLTARVSDSATGNFISFNIDDGSTSNGTSYATNVLKLRGDSSAIFGGNVGIGTASPTNRLNVQGAGDYTATEGIASFFDSSAREICIGGLGIFRRDVDSSADLRINFLGYNGGNTQFRDLDIYDGKGAQISKFQGSTGNLGIGTASPSSKPLSISSSK